MKSRSKSAKGSRNFVVSLLAIGIALLQTQNASIAQNEPASQWSRIQALYEQKEYKSCTREIKKIINKLDIKKPPETDSYLYANTLLQNCLYGLNQHKEIIELSEDMLSQIQKLDNQSDFHKLLQDGFRWHQATALYNIENYAYAADIYQKTLRDASPEYLKNTLDNIIDPLTYSLVKTNQAIEALNTCKEYKKYNIKDNKFTECMAVAYHRIGGFSKEPEEQIEAYKNAILRYKMLGQAYSTKVVDIVENISAIYLSLGKYKSIEALLLQTLQSLSKVENLDPGLTSRLAASLIQYYAHTGEEEKSIKIKKIYLSGSNTIRSDKSNIPTMITLGNAARLRGELNESRSLFDQALKLSEQRQNKNEIEIATIKFNLGLTLWKQGKLKKATLMQKEAIQAFENSNVIDSENLIHEYASIATIFYEQKLYEQSGHYAMLSLEKQIQYIYQRAPLIDSKERSAFLAALGDLYKSSFTAATINQTTKDFAITARLNRHGIIEEIEKRQAMIRRDIPDIDKKIKRIKTINIALLSEQLDENDKNQLSLEKQEIQNRIAKASSALQYQKVSILDVRANMEEGSILIEFQRFKPWLGWTKIKYQGDDRYLALVITKDGEREAIDLGEARRIDQKIAELNQSLEQQLADYEGIKQSLSESLFAPLKQYIDRANIIYISPDAEINNAPFYILSNGLEEEPIDQRKRIRLLTTGREIISSRKIEKSYVQHQSFILANPDYSAAIKPPSQSINHSGSSTSRKSMIPSNAWQPLPGTEIEALKISKIYPAQVRLGADATASEFLNQQNSQILHVASHGYFLQDSADNPKSRSIFSLYGQQTQTKNNGTEAKKRISGNLYKNSLLQSGIVFAGANRNRSNILTALDVSLSNLNGVELVVLSACQTYQGVAMSGENNYGLRRAIAIAGAESSLLSLWSVDDQATANFMISFYKNLAQGESRENALRKTRQEFKNHMIPMWRHPSVWAAFQLSGNWRNLSRWE